MKILFGIVPFVVALPIVVSSAIWQGGQTERWGKFEELDVFAKRIDNIPLEVGDWKGQLGPKMEEDIRKYSGAVGDTQITYTNSRTHDQVNVLIVCGRLMDVWVHRPDRCYPAHGYKEEGERTAHPLKFSDNLTAEFQTSVYSRKDANVPVRVYWGWSSDGKWFAPDDVRDNFKRTRPIFKIQIENPIVRPNQSLDEGPGVELLKVLLPELNRTLFPDSKPPVPVAQAPAPVNGK
jgi:Protein of unknown function (DUF3485)